jgi:hypothetical protein
MVAWWPLDDATNQTAVLELVGAHQGVTRNSAGTVTPIGTPGLWSLPGPALPGVLPVVVDPATSPPRGALLISSAYVEVPHHPVLNIGSNGWTATLWAWPSPGSGASQPLMEKFDVATTNGYSLYLEALGGGIFQLKLNLNGTIVAGPTLTASSTGSDWRFIMARVSAAGQVELGVCDMAGTCTNSPAVTVSNFVTTNTAPLWLGRSLAVTGGAAVLYAVRVALDEVEMFDRALTASELQSIYNAEVAGGRKCEPSSGVAELCVVKFEDLNGDGVRDAGEPGLAGWSFVVSPAPLGLGTNVVTTLKDGGICFAVSAPGTYTIAELGQPGWTPTTLSTQVVTVVPGQPVQVIFGNQRTGLVEICGMKFWDADGDGRLGTGEPGLANWVIEVLDASGNVVGQAVTDTNGQYCIAVPPGTYTVSEQQQSGWVATTPASVTVTVPPAALNVNFGNRRAVGEVCVLKFHDLNQNGVQDAGEPGLAGWSFVVSPPPLGLGTNVVTTLSGGGVCFGVSAPGTYTITELGQPGWTPTTPTTQTVTVQPGQAVSLTFGNSECIPPPPGMTVWWPLDEISGATSIVDVKGGNTGTPLAGPVGSGAGPNATAGMVGGALYFYSQSSYVVVPNSPSLNFGTNDFAIDAWVKPDQVGPSLYQPIVDKTEAVSGGSGFKGYRLYIKNGYLILDLSDGVTTASPFIPLYQPYGSWLLIFVQRSGPNAVWFFVYNITAGVGSNGGLSVPTMDIDNNGDLLVGGLKGFGLPSQPGIGGITIDELEIYNRSLSPDERTAIYNAGSAGKCRPQHGQICVLKFHDLNQNGVRDAGEPALPGWTIQIKDSAGNVIQSIVTATNPVCVSVPAGVYQVSEVLPPPIGVWLPWTPTVPPSGIYSNVTVLPGQSVTLMFGNRKMIKVFNPVLVPSPLRVILRMTAEPGEWYQLQYSETLGEGAVWRDWGDPVQATEPEVRFEVPVTSDQRQLYFRGIEKKDIRRGF